MSQGAWVLVASLVLATAFGGYRAAVDGRFRGTRRLRQAAPPGPGREEDPPAPDPAGRPPAPDSPALPLPSTRPSVLAGSGIGHELGERATLLQFSSAFCAPCRATRRILADVASVVPGVVHVEVDAEHHLELVRRLGIVRTPTTLILDRQGREVSRATGAPRKEQVLGALANSTR